MSVNRKTMILLFIALDEDPIEEDDDEFETQRMNWRENALKAAIVG